MTITDTTGVQDNRNATAEDAQILGTVYRRLTLAVKKYRNAAKAVSDGWFNPGEMTTLRGARDEAQVNLDRVMDESWEVLRGLPRGTVASGGATPQTVALEFFNRNVNRELGKRITGADAKSINKRSFA